MTLLACLDPATPSAEDLTVAADQYLLMHEVLDGLRPIQAGVVCLRLGLLDDPEVGQDWASIAATYGISRSRAATIYRTALERLRTAHASGDHSGDLTRAMHAFLAA